MEEVKMWLQQTPEDFYQEGIKVLLSRWQKTIEK
jgi:hypothetical protein